MIFERVETDVATMGKLVAAFYRNLIVEGVPEQPAAAISAEWMKWSMYLAGIRRGESPK